MFLIFWLSIFMIFYAYAGYPVLLYGLSLFKKKEIKRDAHYIPQVSLIITVHNEEERIQKKIDNSLALEYPQDKLEIIFTSDASTDKTEDMVLAYPQFKLVRSPTRRGKEFAQKCAVDQAVGEILIFSDVATMLDPNGLKTITSNFADSSVGCVSSEDRFIAPDGNISGEGAYVKYEMLLRNLETGFNTLVGLSGSFFAARRTVCQTWPTDLQSDFSTLINSIKLGLRGISDPNSIGYYKNISDEKKEFSRKVRTVLRGITVFTNNLSLLNPSKYGVFSWQLFSHKLCRWLVPFFMALALVSNAFMLDSSAFYIFTFILKIILYALALVCSKITAPNSQPTTRNPSNYQLLRIPYYFVVVNVSILVAWWKYLKGERETFWEPSKR